MSKKLLSLALLLVFGSVAYGGTLVIGRDTEDFAASLPDQLVFATVNGAAFVSQASVLTPYQVNGLADGPGYMYAGSAVTNVLHTIDYSGNLLTSIGAPGIQTGCCNEEMLLVGSTLYHARYSSSIQSIDPVTGVQLNSWAQADVVGMAIANGQIWISKWSGRQVGTWDPVTNIFTPVFNTPNNAGGLAFDPFNQIMWVGMAGGSVVPYDLAGNALNGGFQPFGGAFSDTIDGLTFQGEVSGVPEPSTWALLGAGLGALVVLRRKC
jgi:hypothetical protein